jgi:hypothetical protein
LRAPVLLELENDLLESKHGRRQAQNAEFYDAPPLICGRARLRQSDPFATNSGALGRAARQSPRGRGRAGAVAAASCFRQFWKSWRLAPRFAACPELNPCARTDSAVTLWRATMDGTTH